MVKVCMVGVGMDYFLMSKLVFWWMVENFFDDGDIIILIYV